MNRKMMMVNNFDIFKTKDKIFRANHWWNKKKMEFSSQSCVKAQKWCEYIFRNIILDGLRISYYLILKFSQNEPILF